MHNTSIVKYPFTVEQRKFQTSAHLKQIFPTQTLIEFFTNLSARKNASSDDGRAPRPMASWVEELFDGGRATWLRARCFHMKRALFH